MIDNGAKRNIFKHLRAISDILIIDDVESILNGKYHRAFISYNNVVICGTDNILEFHKLIDEVWSKNKLIRENFTRYKALLEIINLASLKEKLTHKNVYSWLDSIKEQDDMNLWIYREIEGAALSENKIVELGPFCIVDKNHHKNYILKESAHICSNWDDISNHSKGDLLIGVEILVKNVDRGYELANQQFALFENIIKFIIPNSQNYEVSILNQKGSSLERSIAISDNSYSMNSSRPTSGLNLIDFNSSTFKIENTKTQSIFSLLKNKEPSDIENRELRAIDWVGKGLREIDKDKGFIELMFAVETLLSYRGENIIQPSILSRISECVAFTLGNDYKSRAKLEKDFKYLYGVRSAIVHGGKKSVTMSNFMLLKYIILNLIWAFIENDNLRNCKAIEDYNEWIKKKRFGHFTGQD